MMFARLKRSMLPVALLAFSLALPSRSQDAPDHTLGLLNGRWWKNETVEIKLGFIVGYAERRTAAACGDDEWFKAGAAYGEIQESLDDFYREPANSAVPVHGAWQIVAMKFNGKNAAEIQRQTEIARRISSSNK
jgi:hypothetical protein